MIAETTPDAPWRSPERDVARVVWPVTVRVLAVSAPIVPDCEKRFVDDATLEKKLVVVAFPSETFPLDVRLRAVSVVPSNIRLAESVKTPAVVMYGTRFAVREETVRLVVEAVPK